MLILPNAYANDKIEVLNVSDSHKLYSIPNGKRVIVKFTGMAQPVGKSGSKWRRMMSKIVRSGSFFQILDDWRKVPEEKNELFMMH
jgi:hypothetical protein